MHYRSSISLLGMPLVHIAIGPAPGSQTGRGVAKGWIAIGDVAFGAAAFGGLAVGGLSLGGLSVGALAVGGASVGIWSIGGLALALFAVGGAAFGLVAAVVAKTGWAAFQPLAIFVAAVIAGLLTHLFVTLPAVLYGLAELVLPILFGGTALVLLGLRGGMLVAIIAAVIGYLLPGVFLSRIVAGFKKEIRNGLPDALDLLIVCVEAGSGLDQALIKATEVMVIRA